MIKSTAFAAPILLLFAAARPVQTQAQFLKQLLNNVKQTAQNRANSKADQTTNKALDKVDSTTRFGSGGSGGSGASGSHGSTSGGALSLPGGALDTSGFSRVLGAFSAAAAANPNDTSAGDLTMKALGIMTAGGGVSAADSAAAIQSFRTASGGTGIFYQYQNLITSQKNQPTADTSCTWLTNTGEGRMEMRLPMPGIVTGKIVTIGRAAEPRYSVQLYADTKQYGLTVIDTSLINAGNQSFEVTKVGSETINGYSCVHVKMITTSGSAMFKTKTSQDIWTSTGVPGYALYKRLTSVSTTQPKMMLALQKAGADGVIVKMTTADKDFSMTMTLIKSQEKNCPSDLFDIPSGYTESGQNMFQHMMAGAQKQKP